MKCRKSDADSINKTAECLKNGGVVIIPTDTVYGFSGIVPETDSKIREIKGRAENKPFIQLISKPEDIKNLTDDNIPEKILSYWPGPLTIIVNDKEKKTTVAVRCPGDEWLRSVIAETGKIIYSTSVNRSGSPVITDIDEIIHEFSDEVDLIVDDGNSKSSVPSTIVSVTEGSIKVIREGAIAVSPMLQE